MAIIRVLAKPGSKTERVEIREDGVWVIRVRPPAVDGRANERVRELISEFIGCRKSEVSLKSGPASRLKSFVVPHLPH